MNKSGPIIFIEDDIDDQEIFSSIFSNLKLENELLFFTDGFKALEYLEESNANPFLIISDTNLPMLSGFQLREKVFNNEALKKKCIPYLLFTTAASQSAVIAAYSDSIQGFFVKPSSFYELEATIGTIVTYWQKCLGA